MYRKLFYSAAVLLLIGCSSTPLIKNTALVARPQINDTIKLRDSVIVKDSIVVDSLWFGEVKDSLGRVIGDLKVYFKNKIAELKLNEKKDTVTFEIPAGNSNPFMPVVVKSLSWWEQLIFYGGMASIITLLIALRFKRGKV